MTGDTLRAPRVGSGFDVHPFATGPRPLVLCGVTIPDANGLEGHSDADVGTHAVADAILGAAALGDLGARFGVDRPETAGASSLGLLASVVADVTAAGWRIGNVDLTLIARWPRLSPHRAQMCAALADTLHLDVDAVSIKATTTDGLGSIGRGEGIAAWATCMLLDARG